VSRTGRRPGTPGTRAAILAVARRRFATRGYDATSLRAIATEAGVDPALLIHYFGSKEGLFVAAMGFAFAPSELYGDLSPDDLGEAVASLAGAYLHAIDSDKSRNAMLGLVRSAVSNERAATMLREFVTTELLDRIAALSDRPDASLRASLLAAQLVGIAVLRHVVRVESLASASHEEIMDLLLPALTFYLE